uniref:Plastid-encoded RNA polymerase subunit alpha n=1 Tax=Ulva linza TaxID=63409 RepID=A0A173GHB0_9CHLO|nr:DNA-directed RNA polymberase subunit alpha [Ulva linza]ANH54371.1 DNA-directed RNA polymberase subunit alpha [Ulva linza]
MKYTLISCIDSKIVNPTTFYGRFELGPWSSGQALTIANTLRRGLLSELPGTAITFVKIIGTSHEYDTLPGMRECILDILLNIKQITLKSEFKFFSPQIGFLNVKGPGIIRARDLKLPFFIKSIDPDQYIATLNHKGQLNMKFLIHSGKKYLTHTPSSKNYSKLVELLEKQKPINLLSNNKNIFLLNKYKKWKKQRELNKKQFLSNSNILTNSIVKLGLIKKKKYNLINYIFDNKIKPPEFDQLMYNNKNNYNNFEKINKTGFNKIGYFPIDAIFSPIKKVNYKIEVKNSITKKETIFLEIWTNGTIDPRSAIHQTVKILIKLFLPLQQFKINFFNQYKTKLYFNKFNFLYFNKKIIKLTNFYFYKKKLDFLSIKKNNSVSNFIKFKNINFFYKNTNFLNKLFYFYLINKNVCLKRKSYISSENKKSKKSNLVLSKKLKSINKNLEKNNLKKLYINKNLKINILEFDILNLELTSRLYFILKKININKIGDLISFKSNCFYTFNDKIFNLEILKKYDLFELKQSLKKYGIIINNN